MGHQRCTATVRPCVRSCGLLPAAAALVLFTLFERPAQLNLASHGLPRPPPCRYGKATPEEDHLNELATAGRVEDAEAVFAKIREKDPTRKVRFVHNIMLKAYANAGDSEAARALYQRMCEQSVKPNVKTFGKLVESAAKAGDALGAEQWYREMVSLGYTCDFGLCSILDAYARCGEVQKAEDLLSKMLKAALGPFNLAFSSLINAHAQRGDSAGANRALQSMVSASFEPNLVSLGTVLKAHARAGDLPAAEELMQQLEAKGCTNEISFRTLINACAQAEDVERAEYWFERMCAAGHQPEAISYRTVIKACAAARRPDAAEQWLEQMCAAAVEPGVIGYCTVLSAHSRSHQLAEAQHWFQRMQSWSIDPPHQAHGSLIAGFARAGLLESAWAQFQAMESAGLEPTAIQYDNLLAACRAAQRPDLGAFLFRRMAARGVRPTRMTIMSIQATLGPALARKLCRELGIDFERAKDKKSFDKNLRKRTENPNLRCNSELEKRVNRQTQPPPI